MLEAVAAAEVQNQCKPLMADLARTSASELHVTQQSG